MSVAGNLEIMDAIAGQLLTTVGSAVPDLQVVSGYEPNPSPPCIDVFPGEDPGQEPLGFGAGNESDWYTVRVRVATAANVEAQRFLYSMMDRTGGPSIRAALEADGTLGNTVDDVNLLGHNGVSTYTLPNGESALGTQWRLQVLP